jgi:hypothetical protein
MAYAKREQERLMEIATILADIAQVDVLPKVEGRNMSKMLNPKRGGPAAPVGAPAVKPAEVAPVPVAPAPPAPTGPSVTTRGSTTRPS